nr:MAG TPA: hypothetical protein [Caudoviricetes sp.]
MCSSCVYLLFNNTTLYRFKTIFLYFFIFIFHVFFKKANFYTFLALFENIKRRLT